MIIQNMIMQIHLQGLARSTGLEQITMDVIF